MRKLVALLLVLSLMLSLASTAFAAKDYTLLLSDGSEKNFKEP